MDLISAQGIVPIFIDSPRFSVTRQESDRDGTPAGHDGVYNFVARATFWWRHYDTYRTGSNYGVSYEKPGIFIKPERAKPLCDFVCGCFFTTNKQGKYVPLTSKAVHQGVNRNENAAIWMKNIDAEGRTTYDDYCACAPSSDLGG